jgi:tetratricopeptide (TPR) repeat protein
MRSLKRKLQAACVLLACGLAGAQQQLPDAPATPPAQKGTSGNPVESPLPQKPAPQAPTQSPPQTATPSATEGSANAKDKPFIPAAAERAYRQGVLFEREGDVGDAINHYRGAIREFPDYFEPHYALGRLYVDKQGYGSAVAELREAVLLRPGDANSHNLLGYALKHNGDLYGAIVEYREAIRLNPKLATAHNNLANALLARRDYKGAIEHYRAALQIAPKDAQTRMNLASALDESGRPDEAITEYKEALKLDPRNAKIHYNLAVAYQKDATVSCAGPQASAAGTCSWRKDMPSAIAELKEAARLAPDWPTPHIMLTNLLKDSDPKAAIGECVVADGLTHDAKLHDQCVELQKKTQ